jgi:cell wall-associated NlpC family hydrolase
MTPSPRAAAGARRSFARVAILLLLLPALAPRNGAAQTGVSLHVGRLFESDGWTSWRLALDRPLVGPIGGRVVGTALIGPDVVGEKLWGVGGDLTFFRDGRGPYGVGGVAGGFGTGASGSLWGSWSAGLGYDLALAPWASLGAEGRWQELSFEHRHGVELTAGLSLRFGTPSRAPGGVEPAREPSRESPAPVRSPSAAPPLATADTIGRFRAGDSAARRRPAGAGDAAARAAPLTLADSVVATATEMMGKPYQLGGEGEGSDGFDCSGLIQYAYAQHGVLLPRRSTDQAKRGRSVERKLDALEPGDILTFSSSGGPVTHVGMYVGSGRFIHSATHGVQESVLSPDDPYGRWWYRRWVGVRRLLP